MKILRLFVLISILLLGVGNVLTVSSLPERPDAPLPATHEVRALTAAADRGATDELAADDVGGLWAAWEVDDGTDVEIYAGRWTGREWLAPRPVQSRPGAWDRSPSLAVTTDGVPWLAWSAADRDDPETHHLYVSRWQAGHWTAAETVPVADAFPLDCATCGDAGEPVLAPAPDGGLWLAWVGFDGVDDEIYAQHWDGASWSVPVRVNADDDDPAFYDRQPRLAVDPAGVPWLVWTGHQAGVDDEIYASHWTAAGWTPEQTVSTDDGALDVAPALALDADGLPWVAWQGRVGTGADARLRILVARWDAARAAWTAEEIASSPLSVAVDEVHPALVRDGEGTLHLAWTARAGTDTALAGARWQAGAWTEASLIRTGIAESDVALVAAARHTARLLWLDATLSGPPPVEAETLDTEGAPLGPWSEAAAPPAQILSDPFPNRHLAFGDSITWGGYPAEDPHYPYPATLQDTMNLRVGAWVVINAGDPGEGTGHGKNRLKLEVQDYRPKYVIIMEGTNDVSREIPPAEVLDNLEFMIATTRKGSGVEGVEVMIGTILPRLDDRNDKTTEMNDLAIRVAASNKNAPLCDPWQAYMDYGSWADLYWDEKHPGQEGLDLLAATFYDCVIAFSSGVQEESTPPTTWIESLPDQFECGDVQVSWNGSDNLNWVVDYDVQAQLNGGAWTDWLLATTELNGTYTAGGFGDTVSFRVRGRDLVGNQSDYSAPASTQIVDSVAPYAAGVLPLPPIQIPPFAVEWWGADACADIVAYDVQYRVGAFGTWQNWLSATPATTGIFDPASVQYGQTYYFRARAQDAAGNWGEWSPADEVYTLLAQYIASGHVYNVRHQPVAGADVSFAPAALSIEPRLGGGFAAYLAADGDYDITAQRDELYGPLPAMGQVPVSADVSGLGFVLPPLDDVVADGDFEAGNLGAWQAGGSFTPTWSSLAHTGDGAVLMGGLGGTAVLSQALSVPAGLVEPTLSFLVRLDDGAGGSSTLHLDLLGSPISHTETVEADSWHHVWLPIEPAVSGTLTLTFRLDDVPLVRLDEVRLGSAVPGGYWTYLPLALRQ